MEPKDVFATTFRRHVGPSLMESARFHGLLLALNDESFSEAVAAVLLIAQKRGAEFLSSEHFNDLFEWVGSVLLEAEAEFAPRVREAMERAERTAVAFAAWEAERWNGG